MKVAYICGKYRDTNQWAVLRNIRLAERCAMKYWELGYAVICPHLNTAGFPDGQPEMWINGDLEILSRCDVIVVLPNWKTSEGAKREIDKAKELGKELIWEAE